MITLDKRSRFYKRMVFRVVFPGLMIAGMFAPPALLKPARAGVCYTQVTSECDVLTSRYLCWTTPIGSYDHFYLGSNPASGSTFTVPAGNPNGCLYGGLFSPSASDPNVTVIASGDGTTGSTGINISSPSSYSDPSSPYYGTQFTVYYSSRSFNIASGAGSKFLTGSILVKPSKIKDGTDTYLCGVGQLTKGCVE